MNHLKEQLSRLRIRARRLLFVRGISWVAVFLFATLFFVGTADWYWHLGSHLRLLCGFGIVCGWGYFLWRFLLAPLSRSLSEIELAMKIEQRFPHFKDSLTSTVQFANSKIDPKVGSPELQQRVIAETIPQLEQVDVNDVIEQRTPRTAASIALLTGIVFLILIAWQQSVAAMAMNRLLFPYSSAEWRRNTELQLLDEQFSVITHRPDQPFQRSQGETFNVYIENRRGSLPDDVVLEVKNADGDVTQERVRKLSFRDKTGTARELCVVNLLLERGPIFFRAIGGDDQQMSWHRINVMQAPQIRSFRITLTPPKYIGQKPAILPQGVGAIQAMVGTTVRIEATTDRPLKAVKLFVKNHPQQTVHLASNGKQFHVTFRLRTPGNSFYRFQFTDRKGFSSPSFSQYEIRIQRDQLPTAQILKLTPNIRATKHAILPVNIIANDDHALRNVQLRYQSHHPQTTRQNRVEKKLPTTNASNDPFHQIPLRSVDAKKLVPHKPPTKLFEKNHEWDLTKIDGITEGTQIRFHVEADDFYRPQFLGETQENVSIKKTEQPKRTRVKTAHRGKSRTYTITIVSPAEKLAEIADESLRQLEKLARIAKLQQTTRHRVAQLIHQLEKTGTLRFQNDLPLLRRIEHDQQQIKEQLIGSNGLETSTQKLIAELKNNQLQHPQLKHRLERILIELSALRREQLNEISAKLTTLRKVTDNTAIINSATKKRPDEKDKSTTGNHSSRKKTPALTSRQQLLLLTTVRQKQDVVIAVLNELIAELREWNDWHKLSHKITELIETQQTTIQQSQKLNTQTSGRLSSELTDQQQADLSRIVESQQQLATDVEQLQKETDQFIAALRKKQLQHSLAGASLTTLKQFWQTKNIPLRMQETADQIDKNRLGQATNTQKQFLNELREAKAILDNQNKTDLQTLIQQQKSAERLLKNLHHQQEKLFQKTNSVIKKNKQHTPSHHEQQQQINPLIKTQTTLQQQLQPLSSTLRQLLALSAERATQRAINSMQRSKNSLAKNNISQSRIEQQEILNHLLQARRELAKQRTETEAKLLQEILARITNDLQQLSNRQRKLIDRSQQLKTEYETTNRWSRQRLITLDELETEQRKIQSQLHTIAQKLTAAPLLTQLLNTIEKQMQQAANRLAETHKAPKNFAPAIKAEQAASQQLHNLLTALRPEENSNPQPPSHSNKGVNNGEQTSDNKNKPLNKMDIAQWKLLKILQQQLLRKTEQLHKQLQKTPQLSHAQKKQIEQLAEQQSQLAENVRQLTGKQPHEIPKEENTKNPPQTIGELQSQILEKLATVTQQLDEQQLGKATQNQQQQIIENIDSLVQIAKKQSAGTTSTSNQQSNTNSNPQNPNHPSKPPNAGSDTSNQDPKNTNTTIRNPTTNPPETVQQHKSILLQEFWGHLSEKAKKPFHNVNNVRSLPGFNSRDSRYFEALAEDK